jgi:toxin ParE1/3/4
VAAVLGEKERAPISAMTSAMKVIWSPRAIEHLIALRAYIAKDSPQSAAQVAASVLRSVKRLTQHPHIGRVGRVAGTRELLIAGTPYVVPYRVRKGRVELIAVFHGRQCWPELL